MEDNINLSKTINDSSSDLTITMVNNVENNIEMIDKDKKISQLGFLKII